MQQRTPKGFDHEEPIYQRAERLERLARLVAFARSSAIDAGEHAVSVKLTEVEEMLAEALEAHPSSRAR